MDPSSYKDFKTSRGLTYHYFFSAPKATDKPTLLCLHGCPSTSWDWQHVCAFFGARGYGLIVPDLLGYGGTDKPLTPDSYRMKHMVADVVEIVDAEKAERVIALGHDWGSVLCSRVANYRPDRFVAFAFFTLGYWPPMPDFDWETLSAQSREKRGYETVGYWEFFVKDTTPKLIADHIDSFFEIISADDPSMLSKQFCPVGGAEAWLQRDGRTKRAQHLSDEDWNTWKGQLEKGGFAAPSCWYKAFMEKLTPKDDAEIPKENQVITKPTFFGACTKDEAFLVSEQSAITKSACTDATIVEFESDHWVLHAVPQEVNNEVLKWIEGLKL